MSRDDMAPPSESTKGRKSMIRELLHAGEDHDRIISRVVEILDDETRVYLLRQQVKKELLHVIAEESREVVRGSGIRTAHSNEHRSEFVAKALSWDAERDDPGERVSRRAELLSVSFAVPQTGRVVTWGEATEADHRVRAEWYEKVGYASFEQAHMHRRAISELKAAKVLTLNEIAGLHHANERAIDPVKA